MGPTPISTTLLVSSLLIVLLVECAAAALNSQVQLTRLGLIGITRTAQIAAVMALVVFQTGDLAAIGLQQEKIRAGIAKGLIWSAAFAVAAGGLFLVAFMAGQDPLLLIRTRLPEEASHRIFFFLVGGVVAPVAEEIVFRGLVFGYLRRWGVPAAILISTALFASLHWGPALPVTQITGGVVFALAYHTGKSLLVPILIHMLGNLAIFALSLI